MVKLYDQPRQRPFRQQSHVLGEEAEHQTVQEPGYLERINSARPHGLGDFGESVGSLFGNILRADSRLQRVRVVKDTTQDFQLFRLTQVVQQDGMDIGHLVGEVGVNPDGLKV